MRHIAIYLAASVAALSVVGCKLDDGTSRDTDRPARTLWREVSWYLDDMMPICRHLAALDAMLSPEWSEIADKLEVRYFDDATITVDEEGTYDISIFGSYDREAAHYRIATAGQPASEDNPWQVIYTANLAEADMVLTRDDAGLHLDLAADYRQGRYHRAAIDLNYTVDKNRARIGVTVDGGEGRIGDAEENPSYTIAYDIAAPLKYDSSYSLMSAEVEIVYDDFIGHTTDRVRVTVDRGYATYEYM